MYEVGCLNTGSCPLMPIGRSAAALTPPAAPPGLSAMPLATVACGWNGGLPPSSVESFRVTRLWKAPALARTTVFSLSEYAMPPRGSNTLPCVCEKPRGSPRNSASTAGSSAMTDCWASPSNPSAGRTTPLYRGPLTIRPVAGSITAALLLS